MEIVIRIELDTDIFTNISYNINFYPTFNFLVSRHVRNHVKIIVVLSLNLYLLLTRIKGEKKERKTQFYKTVSRDPLGYNRVE